MSLPKQIDIRGSDGQGADERQKVTTPQNTTLVINDSGNVAAVDGGGLADIQNASLGRLSSSTQFDKAPAAASETLVVMAGTGTEQFARSATGGVLLTTQSTTPAAGDNHTITGVANTPFIAPVTAVSTLKFNTQVNITAITKCLVAVGLDETATDAATNTTVGDGAIFMFDPENHAVHGETVANWVLAHKTGGTDTYTDTGIAVVADTEYRLRIEIGTDLKAVYYINDIYAGTGPVLTGASVKTFLALENRTSSAAVASWAVRSIALSRGIG